MVRSFALTFPWTINDERMLDVVLLYLAVRTKLRLFHPENNFLFWIKEGASSMKFFRGMGVRVLFLPGKNCHS